MYVNPEIRPGVLPLWPSGTNSTMFTECCETAIYDEECCPNCKREIIGCDENPEERVRIRWENATWRWKRGK